MFCGEPQGKLAENANRSKHKSPGFPIALRNIAARIPRRAKDHMTRESTDIEVEVVEIDGVTPVASEPRAEEPLRNGDWRQWRGQVKRLDSRWWPLWVILGIIAFSLLITVGLVLGVVFLIVSLLMKLLRAILR